MAKNENGNNTKINDLLMKGLYVIVITGMGGGGVVGLQSVGFGGAMAADSAVTTQIKDDVAELKTRTAVTETEVKAIKKGCTSSKGSFQRAN